MELEGIGNHRMMVFDAEQLALVQQELDDNGCYRCGARRSRVRAALLKGRSFLSPSGLARLTRPKASM